MFVLYLYFLCLNGSKYAFSGCEVNFRKVAFMTIHLKLIPCVQ